MNISRFWKLKDLRNKILIVLGILALTRVLAHVPIPVLALTDIQQFFANNQIFGLLNIFSGGGLANLSVAMLGVGPYITASIIMQLLTIIVPKLAEMAKEGGELGRAKINKYTMYLTVPLTVLQSYATITLLARSSAGSFNFPVLTPFQWLVTITSISAGTMLLVWMGELITNFGIGNGVSLIIFAGIVSRLPQFVQQFVSTYDPSQLTKAVGFVAVAIAVVAGIVFTNESQRNIPVSYAKRVRGNRLFGGISSHLPLRLLQAGVIPIIFAISILIFPPMVANFFVNAKTDWVAAAASWINATFQNQTFYGVAYFALVVLFTYFYTAVVFNPDEIADNVQKSGGFVPGLRPGRQTADYLYKILTRITTAGAVILGLIAVLPLLMQSVMGTKVLTIGGTSILIVVAVAVETMKQIEAQMAMREYEGM